MTAVLTALVRVLLIWPGRLLRGVLRLPGRMVRSVWCWALFLLALIAGLVAYSAVADLATPFTRAAYVQAPVIQVAPEVEGRVIAVRVGENDRVRKGDVLFEIDPRPYRDRVRQLEAKTELAVRQVEQLESERAAAHSQEQALAADLALAEAVFEQEDRIYMKGSTTERRWLEAKRKLAEAQALRSRGQAVVRQKEEALLARLGQEHALIAQARAELAEARLRLAWTKVEAPADGYVTNLQLRVGSYATAGKPVLTCVETERWCVVADFREGNLERVRPGQPAEVTFRTYPGRVFRGRVDSVGWGVSQGQGVPSGELPDVKKVQEWVRPAQRFQVRVVLDEPAEAPMRVGASAAVTVYTSDHEWLNPVAEFIERAESYVNYIR
jgi:multidrug resistance efflux pump